MPPGEQVVDDLVDAILDGTPIDWAVAESNAESSARPVLRQLRVLAAFADFHRVTTPSAVTLTQDMPPRSEPQPAGAQVLWGHLRLVERIGRGAFGEVYRAWDTRLDREVALKLLPAARASDAGAASSIIHEGRLLAKVRHPNVVTIHGAEQIGDRIGLWMEFVRGHNLEQVLDHRKVISAPDAIDIGRELCRAVSAVHGAGLLHRDIKTHNVMRADDGRIVLMDFGTGREVDDDATSDMAGTPLYLAPEVLDGQQATVRSDVYSLGVLLYHLVTGAYPVRAPTVREVRQALGSGERAAVQAARSDVPTKLARVIERATALRPDQRYESADALGADLAALTPRSKTVRLLYAGAAAAVILLATVGWEVAGRQVGSSKTPSALLARFAGLTPVDIANSSAVQRPAIAVLPLENLSAEVDSDFFVDGLTDEIIRNLAAIKGLDVRSRTSSFAIKGKSRDLRDVGRQLGVNLVVDGSVLRAGNKLRVNVQLVEVAGDVPLWTERFDREVKDIFDIQDEISRAIVSNLRLTLGQAQRRYNTNVEAYEMYLKARVLVDRRGTFAARQAAELFEQVIAKDPEFAPAYAGLADAYAAMSSDIPGIYAPAIPFTEALSKMRPAALRALELDSELAEAHAAIGFVHSRERAWENAQSSFQRAIDLDPSLSEIAVSYSESTLVPLGKLAEAEQLLKRASQSDPFSLSVQRELAFTQFRSGRYEEAVGALERIRAVDPVFPYVDNILARALTFAGRPAEALQVLETKKAQPGVQHWMARAYVLVGNRAEVERLAAVHKEPLRLAVIHAALGNIDRTFEALDRAADSHPHRVANLLRNPEMAALRGDPRFAAVLKKLGLP